ncbi:UDP-glucose 4-epimerase GalE [Synechococcus sp. CS-1332]|uniref:UDP-glucose 4-epimerase GalE n=1 Tax=Synechococcus sp. CS-1332 TaxID=2847972 RepID=UPI00223BCFB0|nr:UDP-glucose 4-epimerase GalE [Synechococcus sp. CS-1332]MCT0209050.1 UDP-glucose 4-epimerase GalE [Synechococcus sp. CS-1332]
MATVLITGGAGFIGSHTCLVLIGAGHRVVVVDNLQNSSVEALHRVAELCNLSPGQASGHQVWTSATGESQLIFINGDIRSSEDLDQAFRCGGPGESSEVTAVLHFAGLKAVGDSIHQPLSYWHVNVEGTRCLLEAMRRHACRTIVFSSTAALYGFPKALPIPESSCIQPANPYGQTKAAVEQLLADVAQSEPRWRIARLRYFNPVGAHPSGCIGEDPNGVPSNLFPLITQVAMGIRPHVQIFGSDWPTPDGTGIRDFIHVMDLAEGHRQALDVLLASDEQILTLNLGSGHGHSVLEMIQAFERINGCPVAYEFAPRRPGDVAESVADSSAAKQLLGWSTRRSLEDICRDGWAWRQRNRNGYRNRR